MRKLLSLSSILLSAFGLSACSLMDLSRTRPSGYQDENGPSNAQEFYTERKIRVVEDTKEELGYSGRELSEHEVEMVKARIELNNLEKGLTSNLEKKQYYALKPYFHGDRERIYFLKLPDHESRTRWANARGITTEQSLFDSSTTKLIEKNDVTRGMTRAAVHQSWGEPEFVEVAGDQMRGNERWRYTKLVATDDGYNNESRIIYFEGGVVIGWETLN